MIELEDKAASVYVDVKGGEVTANIQPADNISVTVGQSAQIDVGAAVNYIESGKAEIRPLVDEAKGYKNEAAASAESAESSAESASDSAEAAELSAERAEAAAESIIPDKYFVHEQAIASNTWVIIHGFGRNPSVTVADSAGNVQIPNEIKYDNENQLTLYFIGAFAGEAYLN